MSKNYRFIAMVAIFFLFSMIVYNIIQKKNQDVITIPYSKFLSIVEQKDNLKITEHKDKPLIIQENVITGYYFNPTQEKDIAFKTYIAYHDLNLISFLKKYKITYFKGEPKETNFFVQHFLPTLPYLLILGLLFFFMFRQLQSTGNKALDFGKSRARLDQNEKDPKTFKDVAGVEEAKAELEEIVDFLKDPKKFNKLGARIPKGVLLTGPPGTGKTLLAKAVAGEAQVPFFSISGSDFVEMFVGVGASRVRDLFTQAKKSLPCIIFIDEIDAVGRLRGAGMGGGHDEREQTLNQLLVEMDGFAENKGLIIIAATNRSDVLDPALLRPGRFDRQVMVDPPDLNGRKEILRIHAKPIPLSNNVDLSVIAKGTPGFTGADLANLINEAALLAARKNQNRVKQLDLESSRDKVLMGPERKSCYISPDEKEIIAYHEAGHTILGMLLDYGEPVHRVTIIPRGKALGVTQQLPTEEKYMRSKYYWLDNICILMGGRIAEALHFKDVTTGASNDILRATNIARKMVTEWGMTSALGPISYNQNSENVFIGRDYHRSAEYSDAYVQRVDEEVQNIISTCYKKGEEIIKKYFIYLEKIAQKLLMQETVEAEELYKIVPKKLVASKLSVASSSKISRKTSNKKSSSSSVKVSRANKSSAKVSRIQPA